VTLCRLREHTPFPDPQTALDDPNGLLAAGGDLSPKRLLNAYRNGIFPWFAPNEPILWWSPDPRAVLFPEKLHISRSFRRQINKQPYQLTMNRAFPAVIRACAKPRDDDGDTWITPQMIAAYTRLHQVGYAHSVEVWSGEQLVGGLYGVWIRQLFCAESMFRRANNASKFAIYHLVERFRHHQGKLIDIQIMSPHLKAMGAEEIPRSEYINQVRQWTTTAPPPVLDSLQS
jgi:leucyl/phenylalanyl-tRNA---protein transferase